MGIKIGNRELKSLKFGRYNVQSVFLGEYLVWPIETPEDISMEDLILALSCYSLGKWVDELPWKDTLPWMY